MSEEPLEIHLLADSSGESGARLARAAVAQFPSQQFTLVRHRRISSANRLRKALDAVRARAGKPTAVFLTLVNEESAELVKAACRELDVPYADLMTDAMLALQRISGTEADHVALRPVGVEADYFTRISAIDFAVRNDDGVAPGALTTCDICLVGPSRSGKTPLSIYLGYMGYKAANVPIVPSVPPPPELFAVAPWRIVGLTMNAQLLQRIRSERVKSDGMGSRGMKDGYADLGQIYDELDEVARLHRRLGCPVLDTTGMALEESAARVIDLVEERARRAGEHLRRLPNVTSALPAT